MFSVKILDSLHCCKNLQVSSQNKDYFYIPAIFVVHGKSCTLKLSILVLGLKVAAELHFSRVEQFKIRKFAENPEIKF